MLTGLPKLFYEKFPVTKKLQTQTASTKKLRKTISYKMLLVKCWWNWHLAYLRYFFLEFHLFYSSSFRSFRSCEIFVLQLSSSSLSLSTCEFAGKDLCWAELWQSSCNSVFLSLSCSDHGDLKKPNNGLQCLDYTKLHFDIPFQHVSNTCGLMSCQGKLSVLEIASYEWVPARIGYFFQ